MLLLLLTGFPFSRSPSAARASARRGPIPGHASRRGHGMSGHCRRRLRSAWTVRTPHRQTRQGPWWWPAPHSLRGTGLSPPLATRVAPALVCRPVRFVRPSHRGTLGPATRSTGRMMLVNSASFRRRPVPRSAYFPGRVFNAITPGRLMFLEPSGSVGPGRLRLGTALATGPLRATPREKGNGRSAMPSIGVGARGLNRPARPPQVAARHQRARQPGVRP